MKLFFQFGKQKFKWYLTSEKQISCNRISISIEKAFASEKRMQSVLRSILEFRKRFWRGQNTGKMSRQKCYSNKMYENIEICISHCGYLDQQLLSLTHFFTKIFILSLPTPFLAIDVVLIWFLVYYHFQWNILCRKNDENIFYPHKNTIENTFGGGKTQQHFMKSIIMKKNIICIS